MTCAHWQPSAVKAPPKKKVNHQLYMCVAAAVIFSALYSSALRTHTHAHTVYIKKMKKKI